MTLIEALISGAVQGATEFLPVSSSGHLVLLHSFFKHAGSDIFFDVALHFATLLAVLVFFRRDIISIIAERKWKEILFIAVATVPVVIAAFLLKDIIEDTFSQPRAVSILLIVTGTVLFAATKACKKAVNTEKGPGFASSIVVGLAQAFALMPGISRSGMTICAGIFKGMDPKSAFRFSFLISIPAILGALVFKGASLSSAESALIDKAVYGIGMFSAFCVGLAALYLLRIVVIRGRLNIFGWYCLSMGLFGILYFK